MPTSREHKIVGNPGMTHSVTMQCNGMGHTLVTTDDYKQIGQSYCREQQPMYFVVVIFFDGIGILPCINGTRCMLM